MSLADVVTINITTQNPGVTAAGFGVPLIASAGASWAERTRVYNSLTAVQADFAATTPEYQAAAAIFAQSPSPNSIMIGRLANKPTQTFQLAIASVVSTAGALYRVRLNNLSTGAAGAGQGLTATFTTVGSDTNDSIVTGLKTAVDALAITGLTTTITGTGGSHVLNFNMSVGLWLGIEAEDASGGTVGNLMLLSETTTDPGVTADLTALANASSAWYGLNLLFKSSAIVTAAAAWVEANQKLLIVATQDTLAATQASGTGTDVLQTLSAASRARTAPFYHPRNDEFVDAAETGKFFPVAPGGDNWRMKTLSGPTPVSLTDTQKTNLKAKHANYYYVLGSSGTGANVIGGEGMVSDGEYIDVIRFRDWWVANLGAKLANLLIQNNKVPYTDEGIALVENRVRQQNAEGIAAGGIADSPKPIVTVPKAINVSSADRASRTLNNVNTQWTLAGAINHLVVNASISV